jgi:phosphohistidine swiveling domain-containing protein
MVDMTQVAYDVTTGEWNDSLTGDFLWSNVNIGEAISDVMTPFTWSVFQYGALRDFIEFQGYRSFGNIAGRIYFNISVLASLLYLIGKRDRDALAMIEGTLHVNLPERMEIPILPAPRRTLLSVLPGLIKIRWKQTQDVRGLPALLAANPAWCTAMRRRIQGARTAAELVSLWTEEIKPYSSRVWSAYLSGANHYADYATPLRRKLTGLAGPDDADALISGMSSQEELLASLGPLMGLSQMARGEMTRETYLEKYGHRGPHEFEFSMPRPAEAPAWIDQRWAEFEKSPVDVGALLAQRQAGFEAAWQRFRARYPRETGAMRRQIDGLAPRARLREAIRSEFGHVAWIFRTWALRAGEMAGLGDDVFFLAVDEVLALLSGKDTATAYIPARREAHAKYSALPPYPPIIRGRFDPFRWAADPGRRDDIFDAHGPVPAAALDSASPNAIAGAAGAAGKAEGLVRRLDSPEDGGQLLQGEILVTAQTNIGWTLLFPRAAAIVTDVGAPLSHAAIVARELGIPAVVGCTNATARLKTGDRVRVNGGRGIVEILEPVSGRRGGR